jgi:hypothetical protein
MGKYSKALYKIGRVFVQSDIRYNHQETRYKQIQIFNNQ